MMLLGFMVGAPMFLFGLINLLIGNRPRGSSSLAEIDLARIRYQVENDPTKRR